MGVPIALGFSEDRASGAQVIDGGLRFNTNFYLSRTPGSAGNRRTWTWSGWVKRSAVGTKQQIFGVTGTADADYCENYFGTDNKLYLRYGYNSVGEVVTTQVFRDVSSWYHILFAFDVTQSTASNKLKLYINGVEVTSFSTDTRSSLTNTDWAINRTGAHYLSTAPNGAGTEGLSALLSNVYFIDGQALDPSYFGYTDPLTNTWRPRKLKTTGPNNGKTWSSSTTGTFVSSPARGADKAFDGNVNGTIYAQAATGTTASITNLGITGITKIRLNIAKNSTGDLWGTVSLDSTNITSWLQSNYGSQGNTAVWIDVTSQFNSSTLNSISITTQSNDTDDVRLAGVEINGIILVDGSTTNATFGTNGFYLPLDGNTPIGQDQSGRGNNWTPVNFGGSNTIEKATGALPILNTDGGGKVARVGVRTDSNASSLVLALPLVGIKSDFSNAINSGTSNKTVTATNAVGVSTQSNFYGGSYLLGNGKYLDVAGISVAENEDYTIEFWVKLVSASSYATIHPGSGYWGNLEFYWSIQNVNSSDGQSVLNKWRIEDGAGGMDSNNVKTDYDESASVATSWNHISFVRSSGNCYLYYNGRRQTLHGATTDTSAKSGTLRIGHTSNGEYYLSDYRFYKGLAKYTQNFISASTDPDILPDTPSGVAYSSNVVLAPTNEGAVAFDGSGDYLSLADSNDWNLGSGDFTIEAFVHAYSFGSYEGIVGQWPQNGGNVANSFVFEAVSGNIEFYYSVGSTLYGPISGGPLTQRKWQHLAAVRSGNTMYIFVDGILTGSGSVTLTFNDAASPLTVGGNIAGGGSWNGFISNLHIVKGTALYTSNFTPPTAPISSVANTKLLCCKSNSSATAFDVSPGSISFPGSSISAFRDSTSSNQTWDNSSVSSSTSQALGPDDIYWSDLGETCTVTTVTFTVNVSSSTNISLTNFILYYSTASNSTGSSACSSGCTITVTPTYTGSAPGNVYVTFSGLNLSARYLGITNGSGTYSGTLTYSNVVITVDAPAPTNFNPFTVNINTQRGQESGYCTWNPLKKGTTTTLSNGNLDMSSGNSWESIFGTIGVSSGKWYWESNPSSNQYMYSGIANDNHPVTNYPSQGANSWAYLTSDGKAWYDQLGGGQISVQLSTMGTGDTLGVALDLDNGKLWFSKNGIWMQGNPYTGTSAVFTNIIPGVTYYPCQDVYGASATTNFGQKPFKFPPPAGFQPLALANTPRPTIVRPDQYVGIITYNGNNTTNVIRGYNFKPDMVWLKARNNSGNGYDNIINDSVRGAGKNLVTNTRNGGASPGGEYQSSANTDFISFDNSGFTLGSVNQFNGINNANNIVAWAWKAGGSGGGNSFWKDDVGYATTTAAGLTGGTINPTGASVNTKSGFSIITYTGNGTNATVPHGLGRKPSLTIIKNLDDSSSWPVFTDIIDGSMDQLYLDTTDAKSDQAGLSALSTTTFSILSGSGSGASTKRYVAYIWAEIPGFSKFGSFTGSSDLPFIHTGFKPRWLLIKNAGVSGDDWAILDSARNTYNEMNSKLWPNTSAVEATLSGNNSVDFLANGFKMRSTNNATNSVGNTMIYAAFAETPSFNLYGGQANAR